MVVRFKPKTGANPTPDPHLHRFSTYLKTAQVYDDGSIKAKYFAETIREDEGISPPGHYDAIPMVYVGKLCYPNELAKIRN